MESTVLHQASFFNVRFAEGVFVFHMNPNIRVDLTMCHEFFDVMAMLFNKIGRAYPSIVVVSGIMSMNREARDFAKENQNTGYVYASATLTSSAIWFRMMKLIISIVGSKKLPNAFFTKHDEAMEWLENQRLVLEVEKITEEETFMLSS